MKPRPNRKQSWIVLASLSAVVACYVHFFYLPVNRQIAEMKAQLDEAELEAAGTIPLVAALGATQNQLEEVDGHVDGWHEAAPCERELPELFERIHELTRLAETETTRFEPQSAVAYETFLRIPLAMECRGRFDQLAHVLTGLETMREPIWVKSVEIQATGEDREHVNAEVILDIFADNLEDSDGENLSAEPITQEADRSGLRL